MKTLDSSHYEFARLAVDKAKQTPVNPNAMHAPPRVAIVIAQGENLVGWYAKGHGGELKVADVLQPIALVPKAHAEEALLGALEGRDLSNATAYVTLEPCTYRKDDVPCCADLLVRSGIKHIFVANIDPNPGVGALAWKTFFSNGITISDFPSDLRNEARRDNDPFFRKFHTSVRLEDGASFDYEANGGIRNLGEAGREFKTRWTNRANGSIWAIDYGFNVAVAKHCRSFEQVDDPGRWFEDNHYTKSVAEGEIVIFRNDYGYALVLVQKVTIRTHSANAELRFKYQLRYFD